MMSSSTHNNVLDLTRINYTKPTKPLDYQINKLLIKRV